MLNTAPGFKTHPQHTIELEPAGKHVRISFGGKTIAETSGAIVMTETGYAPVFYIPMSDIDGSLLIAGSRRSRCPFKGEARYHGIAVGSEQVENAMWLYDDPYDEVAGIAGHAAFYADKVTIDISD